MVETSLVAEFRALAPVRRPVAIQHWSLRRAALSLAALATVGLLVFGVVKTWPLLS